MSFKSKHNKKQVVHLHSKCPNCGSPIVNPHRLPHLLCRGKSIPLGQRHTLCPEPTERDKKLIAEAHARIAKAKKLVGIWPDAVITDKTGGGQLYLRYTLKEGEEPAATLEQMQRKLSEAGWSLVDFECDNVTLRGDLQEMKPVNNPEKQAQ